MTEYSSASPQGHGEPPQPALLRPWLGPPAPCPRRECKGRGVNRPSSGSERGVATSPRRIAASQWMRPARGLDAAVHQRGRRRERGHRAHATALAVRAVPPQQRARSPHMSSYRPGRTPTRVARSPRSLLSSRLRRSASSRRLRASSSDPALSSRSRASGSRTSAPTSPPSCVPAVGRFRWDTFAATSGSSPYTRIRSSSEANGRPALRSAHHRQVQ